jgi:purine-nucleoside phosphorylase
MSDLVPFSVFLDAVRTERPRVALVLGSGLSMVGQRLEDKLSVRFGEVPGLAPATVPGHAGCLTLGHWAGKAALFFEGRLHCYEGHSWRTVLRPIHLARRLGARILILTNAAGGIHDALAPGSLMAVRDHIDWTRLWPWRFPGPGGLAGSRPSLYSARLLDIFQKTAEARGIPLRAGVYAQVTGPCYETPAEIRALRTWGADAVGMSTAREIEAAASLGMECAALSCITNRAAGLTPHPLSHAEVLAMGERLAETAAAVVEGVLA